MNVAAQLFYGPSIGTLLAGLIGVLKAATGLGVSSSSSGASTGEAKSVAC